MCTKILRYLKRPFLLMIGLAAVIMITGSVQKEPGPKSYEDLMRKIGYNSKKYVQIYKEVSKNWKLPEGYAMKPVMINGREANWVYATASESERVIIQLHGGGYRKALKDKRVVSQRYAVKMAQISGANVLTIDYRVAPADPYPAALEDSVGAYQWLLSKGYKAENIIISGESAGGGLTLATGLYLRDHKLPMPAALITMSAWADLYYPEITIPYVGNSDARNPYISPVYGDYQGFPPMLLQAGGDEYILKDTTAVAEEAKAAGVDITLSIYPGMRHVFQMMYPALDSANKAWDEVKVFIDRIYQKQE